MYSVTSLDSLLSKFILSTISICLGVPDILPNLIRKSYGQRSYPVMLHAIY